MNADNPKIRVIFDTNVWISFLIGKRLSGMKQYISDREITIVITAQLLEELEEVTKKNRLQKYFNRNKVAELIHLLETIALNYEITHQYFDCRDPKDNFLLDLAAISKADYLVTGDRDLLSLNPFEKTIILTPSDFEIILSTL